MRVVPTYLLGLVLGAALILSPGEARALGHKRDCAPPPTQKVVLEVCHPKTGCKIEVPVCIPCCCQGAPCVHFEPTLIGPGRTVFTWACGHEVIVRYSICGGYRVAQRDH
jgi:hypothetical protein